MAVLVSRRGRHSIPLAGRLFVARSSAAGVLCRMGRRAPEHRVEELADDKGGQEIDEDRHGLPGRARLDGVDFGGETCAHEGPAGSGSAGCMGDPGGQGWAPPGVRQVLHRGDPGRTRTVQPSGPHEGAKQALKVHMHRMRPTPSLWPMAPLSKRAARREAVATCIAAMMLPHT